MVKINRTIRFLITIGAIVCIDAIIDITSIFNGLVQLSVLKIFGMKIDDINMYTSMYASIAILSSSNMSIIKKLEYSIGLFIIYVGIFTFIMACGVKYHRYSLYLTLIVFITMTFPMLLWIMLDDKQSKKITGDTKKHGVGR